MEPRLCQQTTMPQTAWSTSSTALCTPFRPTPCPMWLPWTRSSAPWFMHSSKDNSFRFWQVRVQWMYWHAVSFMFTSLITQHIVSYIRICLYNKCINFTTGDGPFTVFAPNNKAFDNLPPNFLSDLLSNQTALVGKWQSYIIHLQYIVLYIYWLCFTLRKIEMKAKVYVLSYV